MDWSLKLPKRPVTTSNMQRVYVGKMRARQVVNGNIGDLIESYQKPREDLAFSLYETQKKVNELEGLIAQLKGENQRSEAEILKQQQIINQLMGGVYGGIPTNESTRREVEKTNLVRKVKEYAKELKASLLEKESEIENFKKMNKVTKIIELTIENEELRMENTRLRKKINDVKESEVKPTHYTFPNTFNSTNNHSANKEKSSKKSISKQTIIVPDFPMLGLNFDDDFSIGDKNVNTNYVEMNNFMQAPKRPKTPKTPKSPLSTNRSKSPKMNYNNTYKDNNKAIKDNNSYNKERDYSLTKKDNSSSKKVDPTTTAQKLFKVTKVSNPQIHSEDNYNSASNNQVSGSNKSGEREIVVSRMQNDMTMETVEIVDFVTETIKVSLTSSSKKFFFPDEVDKQEKEERNDDEEKDNNEETQDLNNNKDENEEKLNYTALKNNSFSNKDDSKSKEYNTLQKETEQKVEAIIKLEEEKGSKDIQKIEEKELFDKLNDMNFSDLDGLDNLEKLQDENIYDEEEEEDPTQTEDWKRLIGDDTFIPEKKKSDKEKEKVVALVDEENEENYSWDEGNDDLASNEFENQLLQNQINEKEEKEEKERKEIIADKNDKVKAKEDVISVEENDEDKNDNLDSGKGVYEVPAPITKSPFKSTTSDSYLNDFLDELSDDEDDNLAQIGEVKTTTNSKNEEKTKQVKKEVKDEVEDEEDKNDYDDDFDN